MNQLYEVGVDVVIYAAQTVCVCVCGGGGLNASQPDCDRSRITMDITEFTRRYVALRGGMGWGRSRELLSFTPHFPNV